MAFVQRDDMSRISRRQLPTHRSAIRFATAPETRPLRLQPVASRECDHIGIKFRIVVQDNVTIDQPRETLHAAVASPTRRSDDGDVEVQISAAPMLDHKETIEELEGQRGHGKEIKGDDHFAMIGEEQSQRLAGSPRRRTRRRYLATVARNLEPSF